MVEDLLTALCCESDIITAGNVDREVLAYTTFIMPGCYYPNFKTYPFLTTDCVCCTFGIIYNWTDPNNNEPDTVIIPGNKVIDAKGHNPGRLAVIASSLNDKLIYISDVVFQPHILKSDHIYL